MTITVYRAYGLHSIRNETAEEFEKTKKFNKLFETKKGFWRNAKADVFAWIKIK